MKDTKRRGWRKMPGTYAVRLPRGLMTPLFLKTTLRVKWVSLLMNCSFSVLLILIDIGAHQEKTKWNSLVQYTSERSNRLWKTTYSWRTLYWILSWCCGIEETSNLGSCCSNDSWVGPETERIPQPIPDPNNRGHFMDVYQTESTGRTPDDSRENVWRTCMRKIPSVS